MTPVTIDPTFSVYDLLQRLNIQSTLLNHRRTMTIISYEIEHAILFDLVPARVFAGFQRMSRFMPQVKRYQQLAKRAESVYVFGCMDVQPPEIPNVHYIPLKADDQLAKEWFLLLDSTDFCTALATEELTRIDDPDDDRVFRGVWTFDQRIVTVLQEWLTSLVDAHPLLLPDTGRDQHQQARMMTSLIGRLTMRLTRAIEKPSPAVLTTQTEVNTILTEQVLPAAKKDEPSA